MKDFTYVVINLHEPPQQFFVKYKSHAQAYQWLIAHGFANVDAKEFKLNPDVKHEKVEEAINEHQLKCPHYD